MFKKLRMVLEESGWMRGKDRTDLRERMVSGKSGWLRENDRID